MIYEELMDMIYKAIFKMQADGMIPLYIIINEAMKEVCRKELEEINNIPIDAFETIFGVPVSFEPLDKNIYFVIMQDEPITYPWSLEDAFKVD